MRSKVFLPASLLAIGLLSLPALPANALACSLGSVTATGLGSSTSCIGAFSGNDAMGNGTGDLSTKLSTGVFKGLKDWQFVGKSDEGAFSTSQGTSGTWSIKTALTGPFVLSLKSSTAWSAYFFEGMDDLKVFGGSWTTKGVSTKNGNAQDLSHATIYRAVLKTPPPKPRSVPEPGTTAALGLLAVGAIGRLRQQKGVG